MRPSVFAYRQLIEGLPVEYSVGRLLVTDDGSPTVTYVAGKYSPREPVFAPISITPDDAVATVAATPPYDELTGS